MKKKYYAILTAIVLACLMFTACPIEHRHEPEPARVEPWGYPEPFNGYVQGQAFGYRSWVIVRLYFEDGIIYDAFVDPSRESVGWWEDLPVPARLRIIESNSMDITVDGLAGPSTTRAFFLAGERALLDIPGVTADDL